jgi:hypothetical protein
MKGDKMMMAKTNVFRIFSTSTLFLIAIILLQLTTGLLVLFFPSAANVTPLGYINTLISSRVAVGVIFIVTSLGCVFALAAEHTDNLKLIGIGFLFIAAQQVLLLFEMVGPIMAIANSHYADLEIRPRAFIANDQKYAIALGLIHPFVLVQYFINVVSTNEER